MNEYAAAADVRNRKAKEFICEMRVEKNTFRVLSTADKLIVESPLRLDSTGREPTQCLTISNNNSRPNVLLQDKSKVYSTSTSSDIKSVFAICGVLGIVSFSCSSFLVVVSKRELAATLQQHKIWKITHGQLIPIPSTQTTNEESAQNNVLDMSLSQYILTILNSGHLYYSTTYDLTHSIQHNQLLTLGSAKATIDDRYLFNLNMLTEFKEEHLKGWSVKTILGFAGSVDMELKSAKKEQRRESVITAIENSEPLNKEPNSLYTVTLISRVNQKRVGTRYVRRGLDFNGNAANNVEMEQIVFHHDFVKNKAISSYIQMRASAPAVWGQELDLSYRPKLLIADISRNEIWEPIVKHFNDMDNQYVEEIGFESKNPGKILCVNLLNTVKFEGPLTETYEEIVKRISIDQKNSKLSSLQVAAKPVHSDRFEYEEFPLSKYCKNMNYRNMDILLDRVRQRIVSAGWVVGEGAVPSLVSDVKFRMIKLQSGFARVSCLDSLDRTNLTCSIFAKFILAFQIQAVSPDLPSVQVLHSSVVSPVQINDPVFSTRQALENDMSRVTNLWADSGDAISLLYAGTGALKADVTRTGRRLILKGPWDDGLNSVTRYYLNNFSDGYKQDAYDIWTGKVTKKQLLEFTKSLEGQKIIHRIQHPILNTETGILTKVFPKYVVKSSERVLQSASEFRRLKKADSKGHFDQYGNPQTLVGFAIHYIKCWGPQNINSFFELFISSLIFLYIWIFSLICGVKGYGIVNRPMFSNEYETIHSIVDQKKIKKEEESKKKI